MPKLTKFSLAIFEQMPALEELELRLRDPIYGQINYSDENRLNLKKIWLTTHEQTCF